MVTFMELKEQLTWLVPSIRTFFIVLIVFIALNVLNSIIKKNLIKNAKSKKQKSNIQMFSRIVKYGSFVLLLLIAIFTYTGSWTGLGVAVGFISAALGFALQKPITGVAAWMMIIVKRPFQIGDRIIIGNVKGDVKDITLTHLYLDEIGGTVEGEDNSGRMVLVPNSVLFDENIINYTYQDDYILDQVIVSSSYEGNLDKAMKLCLEIAQKSTKEFYKKHPNLKEPYVRIKFADSSVDIVVRYFVDARNRQKIATEITKEIFDNFRKHKDLEIAYPHTEIIYRKK